MTKAGTVILRRALIAIENFRSIHKVRRSVGGTTDTLMMVTNDPLTNVRYVEALSDFPDEGETLL
jgi:hypothetical protein